MTYVVFCLLQKTKLLFGPARRDKKYLKAGYKVLFDLARRDIKYFFEPAGRDIKYFRSRLVSLSSNVAGYNEFEAGLRMDPKVSSRDRIFILLIGCFEVILV